MFLICTQTIRHVSKWPSVTADTAKSFVDSHISQGANYIKLMQEDGCSLSLPMSIPAATLELQCAVVDAAHERGLLCVGHALSLVKTLATRLDDIEANKDEIRLLVHKTGRLLSHASRTGEAELITRLKAAQARLEAAMNQRETATEHQSNLTLTRRSLELEQTHHQERIHPG